MAFLTFASDSYLVSLPMVPDDSTSRESPDEADIVWRLFVQILFR